MAISKRTEFLQKIAMLIVRAELGGIPLICFYFHRTAEDQNRLFKEHKSNCDGYTKLSKHQLWLAMDFVILDDAGICVWDHESRYEILGEIWESYGGTWGGRWDSLKDIYHFEL